MSIAEYLPLGSQWVYVGPGDGMGQVHSITSAGYDQVTTFVDPDGLDEDEEGFSWAGTPKQFSKEFRKK